MASFSKAAAPEGAATHSGRSEIRGNLITRFRSEWRNLVVNVHKKKGIGDATRLHREDQVLTPADFLLHWTVASDTASRGCDEEMARGCLTELFDQIDLHHAGVVDEVSWVHMRLLESTAPSMYAMAHVNSRLEQWMVKEPKMQQELLNLFEAGIGDGQVSVLTGRQLQCIARRWLRLRSCSNLRQGKTSKEEQQSFWRVKEWLEGTEAQLYEECVGCSYFDFLALLLGCKSSTVQYYQYDMSGGRAQLLPSALVGEHLDGIWHTSIVVFGREYWYSGSIRSCAPGQGPFGSPTRVVTFPEQTLRTPFDLMSFLRHDLAQNFKVGNYDIFSRNCNHFSDAVCKFLLNRQLPEEVLRQPEQLLSSPVTSLLRPLLNKALGTSSTKDLHAHAVEAIGAVPREPWDHIAESNLVMWQYRGGWFKLCRILAVHGEVNEAATCELGWLDTISGELRSQASSASLLRPLHADELSVTHSEADESIDGWKSNRNAPILADGSLSDCDDLFETTEV